MSVLSVFAFRLALQERQEIKDLRVAEDCQGRRARKANRAHEACRVTWGYQACQELRDQR